MKNWLQISFLFLFLVGSHCLLAQRGMNRMSTEERVNKQLEAMKERLTLSDAQVSKVEEVLTASADKMVTARDEADGDRSSMREAMMKIRDEQNAELKKYLTAEQFSEYEKMEQEQMEKRRERMRSRQGKSKKDTGKS